MAGEVEFKDATIRQWLKDITNAVDEVKTQSDEYMAMLSAIVDRDIILHFKDEEGSAGGWKPWSSSYADYMNSIGKSGNKILQDSGKMRNSFQPTNVRKESEGLLWFNNAKTGGGFPYAAAHDEGGETLPKRDFMWLSDDATENIADQTMRFITEKLGG